MLPATRTIITTTRCSLNRSITVRTYARLSRPSVCRARCASRFPFFPFLCSVRRDGFSCRTRSRVDCQRLPLLPSLLLLLILYPNLVSAPQVLVVVGLIYHTLRLALVSFLPSFGPHDPPRTKLSPNALFLFYVSCLLSLITCVCTYVVMATLLLTQQVNKQ